MAIQSLTDVSHGVVGALAVCPDRIEWLAGDVVYEEVVDRRFGGCGYAASAQMALSDIETIDQDRLLIGTIDQLNQASRRTAVNAGRRPVLDYSFLPLKHL